MTRHLTPLVVLIALLVRPGDAVRAQIDTRARPTSDYRDGHALDANKQVGSGGYNQANQSPYGFDSGLRANEIITGNVSGLGGFQGYSPILTNNAFRINLPTAALAPFRANTVGLPEVTSGLLKQGPGSYYDPQRTISDAGAISRGLNAPGSSYLTSPYRSPLSPYERSIQSQTEFNNPVDRRINVNPDFTPGFRQTPMNGEPANRPPAFSATDWAAYQSAAGSPIFGMPAPLRNSIDPNNTAQRGLNMPGTAPRNPYAPIPRSPMSGAAGTAGSLLSSDQPSDPRSPYIQSSAIRTAPGQVPPAPDSFENKTVSSPLAGPAVPGTDMNPQGNELPGGSMVPGVRTISLSGGDRFIDLVAAVETAQQAGVTRLGFLGRDKAIIAARATGSIAGPPTKPTDKTMTPDAPPPTPSLTQGGIAELASSAKWADRMLDDPIKSFVGRYQGRLNEYMASAEEALHGGAYYHAARYYEMAATIDPRNPLPLLGRGHALAAAGDYISAVFSLESGISRFPQIAAFRLDLPSIVGRHDAFDVRRADLERRLSTSEDYRLRFLLGYLELYSGLEERGLRDLQQAAKGAPQNGVIAKFPELITGRTPVPPVSPHQP